MLQRFRHRPTQRARTWCLCLALLAWSTPAGAGADPPSVGVFQVQVKWYRIDTPHVVVHYPHADGQRNPQGPTHVSAARSASAIATIAEQLWEPMCAAFRYELKERLHIVVGAESNVQGWSPRSHPDLIEISMDELRGGMAEPGAAADLNRVLALKIAALLARKSARAHAEGVEALDLGGLITDGVRNGAVAGSLQVADTAPDMWMQAVAAAGSHATGASWWTVGDDQLLRMTALEGRLPSKTPWRTEANAANAAATTRVSHHDHRAAPESGVAEAQQRVAAESFALYLSERFGADILPQIAMLRAKSWRPSPDAALERTVGIPLPTLVAEWRAATEARYTAQAAAVVAQGLVQGQPITSAQLGSTRTPPGADAASMVAPGMPRAQPHPPEVRSHPSLAVWGIATDDGLVLHAETEQAAAWIGDFVRSTARTESVNPVQTGLVTGLVVDGWDFIPGRSALVLSRHDLRPHGRAFGAPGENDGQPRPQLAIFVPDPAGACQRRCAGTQQWDTRRAGARDSNTATALGGRLSPIAHTQGGRLPAVSPRGDRIAYIEDRDGGHTLVSIALDGTDKRQLTDFVDNTVMGRPAWSPDGRHVVFSMLRNHQPNLYVVDADGQNLRPLTWDAWEERDPVWSRDGGVYFAADSGGIFNIYRIDPSTEQLLALTNVIGGATAPAVSAQRELLFAQLSGAGWTVAKLPRDQFAHIPAGDRFLTFAEVDRELVEQSLHYQSAAADWTPTTQRSGVGHRDWLAPSVVPMLRLHNDSQLDTGLQGGWRGTLSDAVGSHTFSHFVLLSEDIVLGAAYRGRSTFPGLYIAGQGWSGKTTVGQLIDQDHDQRTTDDRALGVHKRQHRQASVRAALDFPWSSLLHTEVHLGALGLGFNHAIDSDVEPYLRSAELGSTWTLRGGEQRGGGAGPPRAAEHALILGHARAWTDIGRIGDARSIVEDGQRLDTYAANRYTMHWRTQGRVPRLAPVGWVHPSGGHTFHMDIHAGFIDRNVTIFDGFRAGGPGLASWTVGSDRPPLLFAGYPLGALHGETMGMARFGYGLPLRRVPSADLGPLRVHGLDLLLAGTAGNVWSFVSTSPGATLSRGAGASGSAAADGTGQAAGRREIPFVDPASKNGNRMLFDVSAELRVHARTARTTPWDSILRVAYPLNTIHGFGDVNGDGVFQPGSRTIGDQPSSEVEGRCVRIFVGLGTGW